MIKSGLNKRNKSKVNRSNKDQEKGGQARSELTQAGDLTGTHKCSERDQLKQHKRVKTTFVTCSQNDIFKRVQKKSMNEENIRKCLNKQDLSKIYKNITQVGNRVNLAKNREIEQILKMRSKHKNILHSKKHQKVTSIHELQETN
jgi:hypothetical protein